MHELQIAANILNIVEEEIQTLGKTEDVKYINLIVGRMRAIIPETLQFSFDVQKKRHQKLENATLTIEEIDIVVKCRNCGYQRKIKEPVFHCEKCLSTDIEIVSGNELYVDSIELND